MKTPYFAWYSMAVALGGSLFGTWLKPEAVEGFRSFAAAFLLLLAFVAIGFKCGTIAGKREAHK